MLPAAEHIGERFIWAVETMRLAQSDRILEIGCGHGVAVSLICQTRPVEKIVAIDRSKGMIDQAVRRSREHVRAGVAAFKAVGLRDAICFSGILRRAGPSQSRTS